MTALLWTFDACIVSMPAIAFFSDLTSEQQQEIDRVLGPPPTPDAWIQIETRPGVRVIRWEQPDQEPEPE